VQFILPSVPPGDILWDEERRPSGRMPPLLALILRKTRMNSILPGDSFGTKVNDSGILRREIWILPMLVRFMTIHEKRRIKHPKKAKTG
jgi:hypothetical protein